MTFKTILAKSRLCRRRERVTRPSSIVLPSLNESSGKSCQEKSDFFLRSCSRDLVQTKSDLLLRTVMVLESGSRLGHYEIVEPVGVGGVGESTGSAASVVAA